MNFGGHRPLVYNKCFSCILQIWICLIFIIIHVKIYAFAICDFLFDSSVIYVLPDFQTLENFLVVLLMKLSSFIPVWSENHTLLF